MKKIILLIALLTSAIFSSFSQTEIFIDSTITYQTIDGWEAVSNPMEAPEVRDSVLPHIDSLIDIAINDIGITRLRYSLKSGIENPVDYFALLRNSEITYDEYKLHRYSKINDNDDPFDSDYSGFQFTGFQDNLDNLIIPFKNQVEANGEDFYFNLCFVDFQNQSNFHHTSDPEEYAEFMAAAWHFMDSEYHFTPDGLEVILEPDNAALWNKTHVPPSLVAVGDRLTDSGYFPEYIAPSLMSIYGIPNFMDEIAANPEALSYLDVISYHRYAGNNDSLAQAQIVNLANQYNKKTAMLEYAQNGDVNELHYDLKHNNVTAWTKYALMYKSNEKFAYVYVDATDASNPEYGISNQTKYLRQYFKFIRPEAIRIEASTTNAAIDPVAFKNDFGNQVVVIKTEEGDTVNIHGLKPDEYRIKYTTGNYNWGGVSPNSYDIDLPNQPISNDETLSFTMPAKGVATIYGLHNNDLSVDVPKKTNQLSIYPNPAKNYVVLDNNLPKKVRYEIFSMQGDVLRKGYVESNNSTQIDLTALSSGFYLIKSNSKTTKLLKN